MVASLFFPNERMVREFLVEAAKNGYGADVEPVIDPKTGGKTLPVFSKTYGDHKLELRDTWFGSHGSFGLQTVTITGSSIYDMSTPRTILGIQYHGQNSPKCTDAQSKQNHQTLKRALINKVETARLPLINLGRVKVTGEDPRKVVVAGVEVYVTFYDAETNLWYVGFSSGFSIWEHRYIELIVETEEIKNTLTFLDDDSNPEDTLVRILGGNWDDDRLGNVRFYHFFSFNRAY